MAQETIPARFPKLLCVACGKQHAKIYYCAECGPIVKQIRVEVARVLGRAPLGEQHKCVDCGRGAKCRDHKFYREPKVFEWVCVTCNNKRGPALDIASLVAERRSQMALAKAWRKACQE